MADKTAKIQATINGQTVTVAEVCVSDVSGNLTAGVATNSSIALSLDRPVKVDAGTAINLVTVQLLGTATACVHTLSQKY